MSPPEKPEKQKRGQRIKMRIYKNPVKHDGTIIEYAPDGRSFKVEFDGPIPDTVFYVWSESLVTDAPLAKGDVPATVACNIWEVL